ncbi:hypothetical protein HA402_010516 [Bradysia odoriphaga]|nr:hypothetical protein HA402_010516 [Bradysia odoriphaga]
MSIKRRPGTDLNHDNWDQEEEPEEQGEFKKASQEEIAKRTIKTAKRRVTASDNDTGIKPSSSIFSSFAGFGKDNGKSGTSAFSFLSSTATSATNGDSSLAKDNSATSKLPSAKETAPIGMMSDKNQLDYYANLKGLNQSIADWIAKKVEQNPFCILTPIFDDYAKHLKTIQDKKTTSTAVDTKPALATTTTAELAKPTFSFGALAPGTTTPFSNLTKPSSMFKPESSSEDNKGLPAATTPAKPPTFSFGASSSTAATNSTFSFGGPGVKPFMFSNVAKPVDSSSKPTDSNEKDGGDEADEDQPPKYEFVPVVEKDNFYSKRCKVFVKSDKSYADRGVGMLYLKKVEGSGKTQLLVRADTSLGNILLNVLLSEGLPTQRMGKKDVMMICLPLPDAKGATSVLIRVKDEEEANDLLAEINKNKK